MSLGLGIWHCSRSHQKLSVLCGIYILRIVPRIVHAHLHQGFGQLDGGLTTELNNSSIRFFNVDNAFRTSSSQWLKIQLICNIEVSETVSGLLLMIMVFIAFFQMPIRTVYRAVVELYTLSDTDRTGTEYQYFFSCVVVFFSSFSLPNTE